MVGVGETESLMGAEGRAHGHDHRVCGDDLLWARLREQPSSPSAQAQGDLLELVAVFGELVHHRSRRSGQNAAMNDACLLELLEARGEDGGRYRRKAPAKIRGTLGANEQVEDDAERPTLCDEL